MNKYDWSSLEERFWAKVHIASDTECWTWAAAKLHGYGAFRQGGKIVRAHRVSYELAVGPIPEGLTLDHLCRNKDCVNPSHLEPVTVAENIRRAWAARRLAA